MAYLQPLLGGALIGLAASLLLYLNGKVAGISGIAKGILSPIKEDVSWRVAFVGGLIGGGVLLQFFKPEVLAPVVVGTPGTIALAGILVGFGAAMSNGCTSGHGVCGITRLSRRSIIATLVFMAAGMLTVLVMKTGVLK